MARIEVDEQSLRELAGDDSFQRGSALYREGRVDGLTIEGTTVRAVVGRAPDGAVNGAAPCRVELRVGRDGLTGRCDCTAGDGTAFGEHCVAAGLAWLDEVAAPQDAADPDEDDPEEALRAFLVDQDPEWLADELLDAVADDPARYARLLAAAGIDTAGIDTAGIDTAGIDTASEG